ncbi:MAG: endonuclease/exonuclease/phosphatase family protein [Planctomycetota bacterium]
MSPMWVALALTVISFHQADEPDSWRLMVWNIQRGANEFDHGPEKALAVIRAAAPDICLLQESYDIDGDRPTLGRWLADRLGWRAWQGESPHLCVLTRFEIEEKRFHEPWHGVGALVKDEAERRALVYSTWIDWRAYLPYALRDDPDQSDAKLLANETEGSDRVKQAAALLEHLRESKALEGEYPLLVGGDWNCPSHLDWTEDAARLFRYRLALPLPVSRMMAEAGFQDTFRAVHPDPTRTPGITWTPLDRGTPEAPTPADRIDRLYLRNPAQGKKLRPKKAHVLPRTLEPMTIPAKNRQFPSDHGAVIVDLEWGE